MLHCIECGTSFNTESPGSLADAARWSPRAPLRLSFGYMKFFYAVVIAVGLSLLMSWPTYNVSFAPRSSYPRLPTLSSEFWYNVSSGSLISSVVSNREKALAKAATGRQFTLGAALIGLSIIGLIRERKIGRMRKRIETGAAPHGGPPALSVDSEAKR